MPEVSRSNVGRNPPSSRQIQNPTLGLLTENSHGPKVRDNTGRFTYGHRRLMAWNLETPITSRRTSGADGGVSAVYPCTLFARLTMEGQHFLGERCLTEVRELLQFFPNSSTPQRDTRCTEHESLWTSSRGKGMISPKLSQWLLRGTLGEYPNQLVSAAGDRES